MIMPNHIKNLLSVKAKVLQGHYTCFYDYNYNFLLNFNQYSIFLPILDTILS